MKSNWVLISFTLFGLVLGWLLHSLWIQHYDPYSSFDGDEDFSQGTPGVLFPRETDHLPESNYRNLPARGNAGARDADAGGARESAVASFSKLMNQVSVLESEGNYTGATEILMAVALVVTEESQRVSFESTLARIVDKAARKLVSQERYGALDQLYEQIALTLPELAEYNLKLASLRIRMGNESGAFQPLAQIENHSKYGSQARKLLIQLEESQTVTATFVDEIPLNLRGGQYTVQAIIDPDRSGGGTKIRLLVDTGATMTAIDVGVLARLGYDLNERTEYFSTANGVVEAPVVTLGALAMGESTVSRISIGALKLDSQRSIDGLLGMNFLRHFEFKLNQQKQVLELQRRKD